MENDYELDLGLGLSCGESSSKSIAKTNAPVNILCEDSDKTREIYDGFNGFRHGGEHIDGMNNELSRPPENFFNMLSSDGNKSAKVEENLLDASNKRKPIFNDLNHLKRHETEARVTSLYDKEKPSHISITTTDEGSIAESEDVTHSAGNDSMSRFAADPDLRSSQQSEGGASSGVQKHSHAHNNPVAGQTGFIILPENESKTWTSMYNVHHGSHPPNLNSVPVSPFSKEFGAFTMPGPTGNSLQNVIQMGPNASWDQTLTSGNISVAFGYTPFQSQQLGKDHPWGILPRPQQLYPPYAVRPIGGFITNSENHSNSLKLPQGSEPAHHFNTLESSMQNGMVAQPTKGGGKHHITEEITYMKRASATPTPVEVISIRNSTIRPGIAADVKIDGMGSYPDLPWVSTKGSGPDGKTISGVTYRFSPNQIKIVCACHGSHMTPEVFVKHANEEDKIPSDTTADVPSLPSKNPTAANQN